MTHFMTVMTDNRNCRLDYSRKSRTTYIVILQGDWGDQGALVAEAGQQWPLARLCAWKSGTWLCRALPDIHGSCFVSLQGLRPLQSQDDQADDCPPPG